MMLPLAVRVRALPSEISRVVWVVVRHYFHRLAFGCRFLIEVGFIAIGACGSCAQYLSYMFLHLHC